MGKKVTYSSKRGRPRKVKSKRVYKRFKKYNKVIPNGIPATFITRQRYSDYVTLNPGVAGTSTTAVYRLSLYDPTVAVGGTQFMFNDQFAQMYKKGMIIGAKIRVTPMPAGPDTSQDDIVPTMYGIGLTGSDGTEYSGVTLARLMQQPNRGTVMIAGTQNSLSNKLTSVTKTYSMKKFFHKANVLDAENGYWSVLGVSDASYGASFVLWACAPYGTGLDPSSITFMVEISAIVVYRERQLVAES